MRITDSYLSRCSAKRFSCSSLRRASRSFRSISRRFDFFTFFSWSELEEEDELYLRHRLSNQRKTNLRRRSFRLLVRYDLSPPRPRRSLSLSRERDFDRSRLRSLWRSLEVDRCLLRRERRRSEDDRLLDLAILPVGQILNRWVRKGKWLSSNYRQSSI